MTSSRRARLLAAAILLPGACAPVVTHGPRVEPGLQVVLTGGIIRPLCDTGCTADLWPAIGGGLRYGYLPENPNLPAVHAGILLPVGDIAAPEVDLYVQASGREQSWGYGVGVLSSPRHLMPYAQAGRTPINGPGWYVTGGYARFLRNDDWWDWGDDGIADFATPPRYWTPTFTLRVPRDDGPMDVYVSGSFGHVVQNVVSYPPYDPAQPQPDAVVNRVRRPVRMLTAGVSISRNLSSLGPWPTRVPRRGP